MVYFVNKRCLSFSALVESRLEYCSLSLGQSSKLVSHMLALQVILANYSTDSNSESVLDLMALARIGSAVS